MALSDPFETTARLAQQRGQGIEQGFGTLGQGLMGAAQGMQTQQMLKSMGILRDEEIPLTSKDIKDFAKKQGVAIKLDPNLPEEQQLKDAVKFASAYGLPTPKPKTKTIFDWTKAPLGTKYSPSPLGGSMSLKAPSTSPMMGIYTTTPEGKVEKTGEVPKGSKVSMPTPQMKETDTEAKDILEGIKNGTTSPLLTGLGRTGLAGKVIAAASKEGYNLKQAQLDYLGTQTLTKTMNSNQQVNLRTALNSVKLDIQPLRELNNELLRTDINLANKIIVNAKLNGIDLNTKGMTQSQLQVASKFITQMNLMRDNMAVAFMRGGVPTDQAFKLTDGILNPMYGGTRIDSTLDQIDVNLSLRDKAISDLAPYTVGGTGAQVAQMAQQGIPSQSTQQLPSGYSPDEWEVVPSGK